MVYEFFGTSYVSSVTGVVVVPVRYVFLPLHKSFRISFIKYF